MLRHKTRNSYLTVFLINITFHSRDTGGACFLFGFGSFLHGVSSIFHFRDTEGVCFLFGFESFLHGVRTSADNGILLFMFSNRILLKNESL